MTVICSFTDSRTQAECFVERIADTDKCLLTVRRQGSGSVSVPVTLSAYDDTYGASVADVQAWARRAQQLLGE